MKEKLLKSKGIRRILCLVPLLAICFLLMPTVVHADDDERVECEHCGEMRWGDWKCEEGDHCAVGYGCGDKNHCKECGACHTDDDDWCEYCGICFECNPKCEGCSRVIGDRRCVECCDDGSHCPECNESYYDVGLWCAECFRCFDNCVDQCEACSDYEGTEICVECGIEKGNHCEHCGECFVMNPDAWYECDNCDRCALCGDGICDSCGLCYVCLEDIETHCQNCGACNYDVIICQECGDVCSDCADDFCEYCEMCLGCALTLGLHCPTCGSCGESEVGICPVCEAVCTACVAFCDDCEMCVDCATTVYQRHCTECGECVTNVDICQVCGLCSECTGEICYICGLCRTDANQFGFHCLSCGACATEEKNCPVCGNAVKEAVFTSHPGGGVSLAGKPYTIHFSNKLAEQKVYLEKYDSATGRWVFSDDDYTIVDWGTTSYEIPYGTPGKTDRYRLYMKVGYHEVYSKEFEVTWSNNMFRKQPAEGWTRLNADYQIAFAVNDYATDATFELQYKVPNRNMWDTEAMIESPYTYTIPGKSTEEARQYRILCTYNGHRFYSNEFVVMWRKTLHSHTYLARWSKDAYGHWHSANCSDSGIKDLAAHGIKDFAVHTPGPAANGTNPQTCTVCGYIITPAPIVNKENLLKAPESIAFGSRLEVNTDVIQTDDDFIEGYLEGNITWVFTSVSGTIRTYRFTRDPEYFMVTKDMYHGSVHCEVYNGKETVAWVSQEISFDNVHNFSVPCASGIKCSECNQVKSLETPVITAVSNAATGVQVKWNAVAGAAKYRVFYKTGNSGWAPADGDVSTTSKVVTELISGTTYTFTVRCVSADGKTYSSAYDTTGKTITYIAQPVLIGVSNTSNGVEVKWNAVKGADKYRVFYKTGNSGWTPAPGDVTATSKVVTNLDSGTTYTFTVRCLAADGKTYTSTYDTTGKSITYQPVSTTLATPVLIGVSNTTNGVEVKWNAVEGAAKYRVFYKYGTSGWNPADGDVTTTSKVVTGLKAGTTYTFTVRCVGTDGKYTSAYDTTGKSITYQPVSTTLATPVLIGVSNTTNGVEVKWNAVAGAAKYRVFYKYGSSGWTPADGDVTTTSKVVMGLTVGTTYTFTVRCVGTDGKYTSAYDTTGKSITYNPVADAPSPVPMMNNVNNTTNGVEVKWNAVAGAAKYRVFYKTGSSGWIPVSGDVTTTSKVVTGLAAGTTYTFTVRCVGTNGKYTSSYDTIGKSITYQPASSSTFAAPVLIGVSNTTNGVEVKWNAVAGAAKYRVFCKTAGSGWTPVSGDVTTTSKVVTGLTKGTSYTFTVRCVGTDGKYTSSYDTTGKTITVE